MKYVLLMIVLSTAPLAQAQWRRSSSDLPEEYDAIVDRNMFVRDRQRPPEPSTQPTTRRAVETPPDVPERHFVLRGIVIEDDVLRAYFENTRGGVTRVAPGEAIATGHVTEIAIDAVAYALPDGGVKWIEIGQNLEGVRQSAPRTTTASGSSSSTTTPSAGSSSGDSTASTSTDSAGGTGASTDTANMSLEERMRLRAQQRRR